MQSQSGKQDTPGQGTLRAPRLARVELAWRLRQLPAAADADAAPRLVDAMQQYYRVFCHKAVVVSDLAKYVEALSDAECEQLRCAICAAVKSSCGADCTGSGGHGMDASGGCTAEVCSK